MNSYFEVFAASQCMATATQTRYGNQLNNVSATVSFFSMIIIKLATTIYIIGIYESHPCQLTGK